MSKSFKNISVVASATMVSRVLGLGRDMLVTAVFGLSSLADAFYTAFTLPNLFRRLLGEGALTAAFVPTLNDELQQRQRAGAFALVNQVVTWLFVVTSALVAVAMALFWQAPPLANRAAAYGLDPGTIERWVASAHLAVILFPYLVCVCLAAAFSASLQTLGRFLEPALSPIWLNVAMIATLGGAVRAGSNHTIALLWLCGGALIGGAFQMLVPAAALMREGWRPRLDFTVSPGVRQILRLMGPTVFGSAIYLINMAVSRFIGVSLSESAATVLNLATRLMELPIGVFAVAVTTVVFPLISKYAAAGDWQNLALAYRKGMRLILVINVPAAAGLLVLATPIIRLLFQRGAFSASDTAMMRPVLVVFALGLPIFSFVNIVLRAFYAQKDTRTPVQAALISFIVNFALSLILMRPLGTVGLAVASNVAILTQAAYLQWRLARKHEGLAFRHVLTDLAKIIGATAAMAAVAATGWWIWSRTFAPAKLLDACALALLIAVAVATYGTLLWALRIEGRDDLAAVLGKLRSRVGLGA